MSRSTENLRRSLLVAASNLDSDSLILTREEVERLVVRLGSWQEFHRVITGVVEEDEDGA